MTRAKAPKTADSPDNTVQVLKEATCPTSSGKSILGYQVGVDESKAIHLKVASNDGGGFFSDEWISFLDIQAAIEAWPADQGITSMAFRRIFRGKSANTPGFLIAVLVAEGLLVPEPGKSRVHLACDPSAFLSSVSALQGDAAPASKKRTPRAKTASKVKSPARATAKTAKTPRKSPASSRKGK